MYVVFFCLLLKAFITACNFHHFTGDYYTNLSRLRKKIFYFNVIVAVPPACFVG